MSKTGRDLLPHIFKNRGVPTKHDPAKAIAEIRCPSCDGKSCWRIVSTRTLKTTKDLKRHAICVDCGYLAVFMEREIDGVPIIALAPDKDEAELLERIEVLTDELKALKPKLKLLDEVWEFFEPGSRKLTPDELKAAVLARAGGPESGPNDAWAPVRKALRGHLDDKTPATPEGIAEAVELALSAGQVEITRAKDDAKGYYDDKLIATRALEAAGAKKEGDAYLWPFYDADGKFRMLPVAEWIRLRKEIAVEFQKLKDVVATAKTDKIAKKGRGKNAKSVAPAEQGAAA